VNEWTHLCFVYTNNSYLNSLSNSSSSSSDQLVSTETNPLIQPPEPPLPFTEHYTVELFVNGQIDIKAAYLQPALSNNASLLFFKDKSFTGPKSFVQGLEIWEGSLSGQKIRELYSKGTSQVEPVNVMIDILFKAGNSLLPFVKDDQEKVKRNANAEKELMTTTSGRTTLSEEPTRANKGIMDIFVKRSQESINECESFMKRLDIHAESSEIGSVEGLLNWSKLLFYGFEIPNSKCGFSFTSNDIQLQRKSNHQFKSSSKMKGEHQTGGENLEGSEKRVLSIKEIDENLRDISRAVYGFVLTIEKGSPEAILPLSINLLHGIGLESLIYHDSILSYDWDIPFSLEDDFSSFQLEGNPLRRELGSYLVKSLIERCVENTMNDQFIGFSTLCQPSAAKHHQTSNTNSSLVGSVNDIALGLMYLAAFYDNPDAHVALAYR
jgi:hypothetical protein